MGTLTKFFCSFVLLHSCAHCAVVEEAKPVAAASKPDPKAEAEPEDMPTPGLRVGCGHPEQSWSWLDVHPETCVHFGTKGAQLCGFAGVAEMRGSSRRISCMAVLQQDFCNGPWNLAHLQCDFPGPETKTTAYEL